MTLDQWLSKLYQAEIRMQLAPALADFKAAIAADPADLGAQAKANMAELDAMIKERGRGACAYSAKYDDYLHEALDT